MSKDSELRLPEDGTILQIGDRLHTVSEGRAGELFTGRIVIIRAGGEGQIILVRNKMLCQRVKLDITGRFHTFEIEI
ncbi:MAG: hypothetical protein JJU05_14820 [Verrucomicrobia bacterium]|nr:hypothetical protein [Verrucomicrobiota bacterium]MCH8529158.1 hypothetical protein [Kiritimatiellia bacterium]